MTLAGLRPGEKLFEEKLMAEEEIKDISQIYIVACGSAYHVGIAAQYVIEDLAKIPVRVELGSEFRYRNPLLDPKGLVIVISQSGETADSLAALRESKEKGVRTMAIVNVVGSSRTWNRLCHLYGRKLKDERNQLSSNKSTTSKLSTSAID